MDSRISQLHNAILDKTQQFKIGDHIKTLTDLLTNEKLTLADIKPTFQTIREMDKSIFLDASLAAAYDIVLQLDEAIILRHFAESNSLDSKEVIKTDYIIEINGVIEGHITQYKKDLQQKIVEDTQHLLTTHNAKIRTLNEKITLFNDEPSSEAKDASAISQLIAKEKRFAAYQSLHHEVKTLESETFQLTDVKLEIKSPTLEINALFPEFDARITSLQDNIKRQQQQSKAISAYETLLIQIEKALEKYNKDYVDVEYKVTKAIKFGVSAAKSASDAVASWMPFSQSSKTVKVESKESAFGQPKTPAERHDFLNQALKELPSKLHIKLLSQQEIETLKQKKLAVEEQLKKSFELNFSAENIQRIKAKIIQDQQNKLRHTAEKTIEIIPPLAVSEEEWNQALKNESLENVQESLKKEEFNLNQALEGISQNSDEYSSIQNRYAPAIQNLRRIYYSKKEEDQGQKKLQASPEQQSEQKQAFVRTARSEQDPGDNSQSSIVEDKNNNIVQEIPTDISSRSENASSPHLNESSRSIVSSSHSSRSEIEDAKEQPASHSSPWLGRAAVASAVTLLVVGSILTGGILAGFLTGSYLLYLGMGALGLDVLGGLTYVIKKVRTKCCSSERVMSPGQSNPQSASSLHQARNGGGNNDIRRGLSIPQEASGSVPVIPAVPSASSVASVVSVSRNNRLTTDSPNARAIRYHAPGRVTSG